jgi:putative membrane protein
MWPMHDQMGWMWLWWLLGLALLVLLVWVIARAAGGQRARVDEESPAAILERRYARGEIDEQEYERRLKTLRR